MVASVTPAVAEVPMAIPAMISEVINIVRITISLPLSAFKIAEATPVGSSNPINAV